MIEIQVNVIRTDGIIDTIVMESQCLSITIAVINDGGEIIRVHDIRGVQCTTKNSGDLQKRAR